VSAKVSEETARRAVEQLVGGATKDQAAAGQIPSPSTFEGLARKIVADTVARHEDGSNQAAPHAETSAPDRLSRGEVGPDTVAITRYAGTEADGITRLADQAVAPDTFLQARLYRLSQYPDWFGRLYRAHLEGQAVARRLGATTALAVNSIVADFVIDVATQSATAPCHKCGGLLGDWRMGGACESCARKQMAGPKILVH
jgi:hypothetical protein